MDLNGDTSSTLVCFLLKGQYISFCWSENFLHVKERRSGRGKKKEPNEKKKQQKKNRSSRRERRRSTTIRRKRGRKKKKESRRRKCSENRLEEEEEAVLLNPECRSPFKWCVSFVLGGLIIFPSHLTLHHFRKVVILAAKGGLMYLLKKGRTIKTCKSCC